MSFIKRNKEYFIAPLITMLIVLIVYAVKGVYPFGDRSIAYYDMPIQYVPLYHHTFDVLHGKAPAFLDWYNGAGADFTANSTTYLLHPMNLFFLFVKRGDILYSMSFFLMIKLMLASVSMTFYLRKSYSNGFILNTALSLMYTFCGFMLQNYVNIFFIDFLILFPLFMLALVHLLKNAKPFWYTVVTAYMYTINGYLCDMVLIFTVFYAAGYLFFMQSDNKSRGRSAANLGLYTFTAIIITAVVNVATTIRTLNSPRMNEVKLSYFDMILTREGDFDVQKQFMMFGSEFGIAALALTIFMLQRKKQKLDSDTKFRTYLAAILLIPIVSEGSNLLWHMGSYVHFPYRFGYILTFVFIDTLAHFLSKHNEEAPIKQAKSPGAAKGSKALALVLTAAEIGLFAMMCKKLSYQSIPDTDSYMFYGFVLILSLLSAFTVLSFCGKKMRTAVILSLAVLQSGAATYGFIAPNKFTASRNNSLIVEKSDFDVPDDNISRIKSINYLTFPNYQQYIGLPTLNDWTLNISKDFWKTNAYLGYSHYYTNTYDNGGTAFSDALMNVKQAFSTRKYDDSLYSLARKTDKAYIYDCNYTLPFGILVPEILPDISYDDKRSVFDNQNAVYKSVTGSDEDLFSVHTLSDFLTDEESEFEITMKTPNVYAASIELTEPSVIYAFSDNDESSYQFKLNGEDVIFPYLTLDDNTVYPGPKDCGIVLLGSADKGKIRLSLASNIKDTSELVIGIMSIPKLEKLCSYYSEGAHAYDVSAKGSTLTMKVDDPQGRYIFIPVEYSKNWSVKVNGKKAEVKPSLNNAFMAIKLGDEDADIEMKFIPYDNIRSLFITVAGIAVFVLLMVLRKKKHDPAETKGLQMTALVCFAIVSTAALIAVYAIPSIGYFISLFRDITG